jgi:hypothetical protein
VALNEQQRKASATFGGDRFPMPDAKHARLALQMLPRAKNISSGEQAQVRARATRMLGAKKALAK